MTPSGESAERAEAGVKAVELLGEGVGAVSDGECEEAESAVVGEVGKVSGHSGGVFAAAGETEAVVTAERVDSVVAGVVRVLVYEGVGSAVGKAGQTSVGAR